MTTDRRRSASDEDTEVISRTDARLHDVKRDTRELWEVVESIDERMGVLIERSTKWDTTIALLEHRVAFLERLVYGVVGILGTSFVVGIAALVIKVTT